MSSVQKLRETSKDTISLSMIVKIKREESGHTKTQKYEKSKSNDTMFFE